MKKRSLFTVLIFSLSILLYGQEGQEPLYYKLKNKNDEAIYFELNKKLELTEKKLKGVDFDSKRNVNAKDNSINLYFKWLNPLKYKLTWKDTTLTDPRDKAISDFFSLVKGQFDSTNVIDLSKINTPDQSESIATNPNEVATIVFIDKELSFLGYYLQSEKSKLKIDSITNEVKSVNQLLVNLKKSDLFKVGAISNNAVKIYKSLFNYSTIKDLNNDIEEQEKELDSLKNAIKKFKKEIAKIPKELESFSIENVSLNNFIIATVNDYYSRSSSNLKQYEEIIKKLTPIIDLVKESKYDVSSIEKKEDYVKVRSAEFDDGKILKTTLTIDEFEFKEESKEFVKKKEVIKKTFVFQRYDIVDVSMSTGAFIGNTTLKGFGVESDGNDAFNVVEDDIEKYSFVPAIFLNLGFKIKNSRYISPAIQLGIDPTKKRPFFLLGGGILLPTANFSITAGGIWTLNPTLDKLTVGQTISATTELDKDIKYKFEIEPKGWYVGIQWNFL